MSADSKKLAEIASLSRTGAKLSPRIYLGNYGYSNDDTPAMRVTNRFYHTQLPGAEAILKRRGITGDIHNMIHLLYNACSRRNDKDVGTILKELEASYKIIKDGEPGRETAFNEAQEVAAKNLRRKPQERTHALNQALYRQYCVPANNDLCSILDAVMLVRKNIPGAVDTFIDEQTEQSPFKTDVKLRRTLFLLDDACGKCNDRDVGAILKELEAAYNIIKHQESGRKGALQEVQDVSERNMRGKYMQRIIEQTPDNGYQSPAGRDLYSILETVVRAGRKMPNSVNGFISDCTEESNFKKDAKYTIEKGLPKIGKGIHW